MSTEADDRRAIGDWAIRSLREAIEAGKPITVAELEVLQAAAEARGERKAIERLRELSQRSRTWRGPQIWFDVDTAKQHAAYLEATEGATG